MTSRILDDIHNSVKNLHQTGLVDTVTMRKFDELCLDVAELLSKTEIKKLRLREKVSQPIFAKFLNVSSSTVKKWESGEKHPSGAALRLLHIIKDHGIAIIVTSNVDKEMKKSSLKFSKPQADLGTIVDRRELKTRNNGN